MGQRVTLLKPDQDASEKLIGSVVPDQRVGGQSNVGFTHICADDSTANQVYENLKILMNNVNHWHRYVKGISAFFIVTDNEGRTVREHPTAGDHFKIRIPGPKLRAGDGYDWITVADKQEIEKDRSSLFYMTAVPGCNPTSGRSETAHFLQNEASTTFIALKQGREVRMLIRSRNEVPNVHVENFPDRVRNRMVGFFAAIYLSRFQWDKLARSLLKLAVKGIEHH